MSFLAEFLVFIVIMFIPLNLATDIAGYGNLREVAQSVANDARDVMTATGEYNEYVESYIAYRLRQEKQNLDRWDVYVDEGKYTNNSLMEIRLTTYMRASWKKFYKEYELWPITAYSSGFSHIQKR
jgi:hypothetical protein